MLSLLIAFAVAFAISSVTSLGGISGAFLILPFQVSVLGFTGPAVTPTNHLYNIVATPAGILRFVREGRMLWPLAAVIVAGTVPGVIIGSLVRIYLLPDPTTSSWSSASSSCCSAAACSIVSGRAAQRRRLRST